MPTAALRSLKYEYDLFVEAEIERYKESVPRTAILKIADEAVVALQQQAQYELQELALCDAVDRIIRSRQRVPSFATWKKKRSKVVAEFQRPEHWGIAPDEAIVRTVQSIVKSHVLVAGSEVRRAAVYLAAHGCDVTAVGADEDAMDRVVFDAATAGLNFRLRAHPGALGDWQPDVSLSAVICTAESFAGLTATERTHVIDLLKSATNDGGVHLVGAILAGQSLTMEELRERYSGWEVAVERASGSGRNLVARKRAA